MLSAVTRRSMAFVSDEQYKMTEGQVVSFARKCSYDSRQGCDSRHSQILLSTTTGAKRQSRCCLRLLDAVWPL
ncbi:hypothetical protein D5663_05785 [Enterococcus faecalis]|uniref:Uncharacterized protein n=1 Tax=Enterococcus faecalis TaxID=1351 RepID=A0A4U4SG22_ENTFL|nr:hypothetical protein [Enterococcus faecalis]EGO8533540.1 hypothetical protein [Enterococcus faecalis]EGO8585700.1 hypothetical protein [Enterococcus faecalis]EGO8829469.1 hypothetical protein [Enterococcus faecalis]EGO8960927.1 hypothetical protein [Enterococcus faecalis]